MRFIRHHPAAADVEMLDGRLQLKRDPSRFVRGGMLRERRGSIHGGTREPRRVAPAAVPALCAVAA